MHPLSRVIGALLVVASAVTAAIGVVWVGLDAVGTEWDFCPDGADCVAGWKMGTSLIVLGGVAGFLGLRLARRPR